MNQTDTNPENTIQHWAVRALGAQTLERISDLLSGAQEEPTDRKDIQRATLANEIALLDCLDELRTANTRGTQRGRQARQAGLTTFRIKTMLNPPESKPELLELCAQAVCGDRQRELRTWLEKLPPNPPRAQSRWDQHLQEEIQQCWLEIFQRRRMDAVAATVETLREEQRNSEPGFLMSLPDGERRSSALRLASFYHWARATEIMAILMLGEQQQRQKELDEHFRWAIQSASRAGDPKLEMLLHWLRAAAGLMTQAGRTPGREYRIA